MKSRLIKQLGNKSLVAILFDDNTIKEYCVCSNYNPKERFGVQWDLGHYFKRYFEAYSYLLK